MNLSLPTTLMIAFALLAGMGLTSLLLDRDIKRREALRNRLLTATRAELRIRKTALRSLLRTDESIAKPKLIDRLACVPGFDLRQRAFYPRAWLVILLVAFAVGRLLTAVLLEAVGPMGWLSWPVFSIMISRSAFAWMRARRDAHLLLQFPDALGMLVRSVRAGLPLTDAVRVVARESPVPTNEQFQVIVADLMIGMSVAESLARLAARTDLAEYHFFSTALTVQTQTGGRLSETLEGLADMIRKRVAAKDRALALASEARTSALILAALPIVAGVGLTAFNWTYMEVMFTTPEGHKLLGSAAGSLGFGLVLMHTIIRKSVS